MTDTPMKELRVQARALGINMLHMSKDALAAAIAEHGTLAERRVVQTARAEDNVTHEEAAAAVASVRAPRTETRAPTGRKARVPLGTPRQKLAYATREGYVRRWFNDHRTRIHDAEAAGYEFVKEDVDGRDVRVGRVVGVMEDGSSPMTAYLMEIRREFYEEDQRAKQKPLDEFDADLRRNVTNPRGADRQDRGAFYTPAEGSSIRTD